MPAPTFPPPQLLPIPRQDSPRLQPFPPPCPGGGGREAEGRRRAWLTCPCWQLGMQMGVGQRLSVPGEWVQATGRGQERPSRLLGLSGLRVPPVLALRMHLLCLPSPLPWSRLVLFPEFRAGRKGNGGSPWLRVSSFEGRNPDLPDRHHLCRPCHGDRRLWGSGFKSCLRLRAGTGLSPAGASVASPENWVTNPVPSQGSCGRMGVLRG